MSTDGESNQERSAEDEGAKLPEACAAVGEILSCAIDGQLSDSEKESLNHHLAGCAACRRLLEQHRVAWELLDAAPASAPRLGDPEFLSLVRGRARPRVSPLRAWIAAAAVFLLCGGLGWHRLRMDREESAVIENLLVLEDLAAWAADAAGPEGAGIPEVGRELMVVLHEGERPSDEAGTEVEDLLDLLDVLIENEEKGG